MNKMEYLKKNEDDPKVLRTEIWFTPLLLVFPLIIGSLLIFDWYVRGYAIDNSEYTGELIIGLIIIIGNIMFDIPFIKSLIEFSKKD